MSTYAIELNDEELRKQMSNILDKILKQEMQDKCSNVSNKMNEFVKDVVYAHKDEIIEKIIDRATTEMVKKGLPKLLERLGENNAKIH